jgi:murein DD-endopeptidase MepM/ murein hydrolase activator NlpD
MPSKTAALSHVFLIAVIGSLTWIFALWLGPRVMPGPPLPEVPFADFEAEIDPVRSVLALSVPDGHAYTRGGAISRIVKVNRGDTMMKVLRRAGLTRGDAHQTIAALRGSFNPKGLKPGMTLTVKFDALTDGPKPPLVYRGLEFKPRVEQTVRVQRSWDNRLEAHSSKVPLIHSQAATKGVITSSLYVETLKKGVPMPVVAELIRAFSFDVDFQRGIHPNDGFELLYDRLLTPDGTLAKSGDVIYGALILRGKRYPLYRHRMSDGNFDYFNAKGESVRKALMRTPIDGARLSSRYGRRRHPILGYTKMHRGIDFAAPPGTRIMAAGHGVVTAAGRKGSYGLYVRIRHNATYSTAYAHMRAIARGVRRGRRVRQGQTIGYVGSTGRSTGPHLHYEILRNNRHINPLGLKLPTGKKLRGAALKKFLAAKGEIDAAYSRTLTASSAPQQVKGSAPGQ